MKNQYLWLGLLGYIMAWICAAGIIFSSSIWLKWFYSLLLAANVISIVLNVVTKQLEDIYG